MRRQRSRDTSIEPEFRCELRRRGLRYRVDDPVVLARRRHDVLFSKAKVAVDVRGCFWHGCAEHGTMPKSNQKWWREKLNASRHRDDDSERRLRDAGWEVVVVWEHDDVVKAANVVEVLVRA